jgi:hypothetical protein
MAITNLTLGIGLQGKPNDYTNLYAKEYARKAATDAAKAKQDKDEFNTLVKDFEFDMSKVHQTLRPEFKDRMQGVLSTALNQVEENPQGAISYLRRMLPEFRSMAQSYYDVSDGLFSLEKVDRSKVFVPKFMDVGLTQAKGTQGWLDIFNANADEAALYGVGFDKPNIPGGAFLLSATLVPQAQLEKQFRDLTSQAVMDVETGKRGRIGSKSFQYYRPTDEALLEYGRQLFENNPVNLQNARIARLDIFDESGNLDENKLTKWAIETTTTKDREQTDRESRDGDGRRGADITRFATTKPDVKLQAGGYDFGIVPSGESWRFGSQPVVSVDITEGAFEGKNARFAEKTGERTGRLTGVDQFLTYTGNTFPILKGQLIPGPDGKMVEAKYDITVYNGQPIPIEWLQSPNFLAQYRIQGKTAMRVYGRYAAGTTAGNTGGANTETTVWFPVTADNAARFRADRDLSADRSFMDFISSLDEKGYLRSGAAPAQTPQSQRPAAPAPAPASTPTTAPTPQTGGGSGVQMRSAPSNTSGGGRAQSKEELERRRKQLGI